MLPEVKLPVMTYTEIWYEMNTLSMEIKDMDDASLVDECVGVFANYTSEMTDSIIASFFQTGYLSDNDRKSLIGYYILCNSLYEWELE